MLKKLFVSLFFISSVAVAEFESPEEFIVLSCTPQSNKNVRKTCIVWMKREYLYWKSQGLTDEQAEENTVETLPMELYPE